MILPRLEGPLVAEVEVPPSKSLSNRALVAGAVAGGGEVRGPLDCDDTRVLADALAAAGWKVEWRDSAIRIGGRPAARSRHEVWLADSGTGARLMLALLAATPGRFVVDGSDRLRERPMAPLLEALASLGARCSATAGRLPVTVDGAELEGGEVVVRPHLSSQFVSALMLAAPLMRRGLGITVAGPLPSRPYVDLTTETLERIGATVRHEAGSDRWVVEAGGIRPTTIPIEGDWSAAAFFVAAAAVGGGRVEIRPLRPASPQGDRRICEIVQRAGARVSEVDGGIRVEGPIVGPIEADLIDTPDLFPALSAAAAVAARGSCLTGLDHLRHKESDRLAAMVSNLSELGAELVVTGSSLRVLTPVAAAARAHPRPVHAVGDHRIAMAMAVVALVAGPLRLDDPACVSKSFPSFWRVWEMLTAGGRRGASPD